MELTSEHKKKIKKIVAKADKQTMTVKTVRRTLEKSLGLDKDALKPLKEELTAYVTLLIDPPTPAKEKKKPEPSGDPRLAQLKKLATAVRAGPTLYRGIKDLEDDERRVNRGGAAAKGRYALDRVLDFIAEEEALKERQEKARLEAEALRR